MQAWALSQDIVYLRRTDVYFLKDDQSLSLSPPGLPPRGFVALEESEESDEPDEPTAST